MTARIPRSPPPPPQKITPLAVTGILNSWVSNTPDTNYGNMSFVSGGYNIPSVLFTISFSTQEGISNLETRHRKKNDRIFTCPNISAHHGLVGDPLPGVVEQDAVTLSRQRRAPVWVPHHVPEVCTLQRSRVLLERRPCRCLVDGCSC